MKKRFFALLVVIFVFAAVFAAPGVSAAAEKKRVAILIADMTATYAAWLAQSFQELTPNYSELDVTILDCKNNMSEAIANLENAVTQKYDMVLVQPVDADALASQLDITIDAGIPVCVVNLPRGEVTRASNVDADPIEQGAVPAKVAKELIPQNGKVVVLHGPSGNAHSIGRRVGFKDVLFDARPDIEILDEQIANWFKDEGMRLMEDWLQRYPQIDAVISMNDAMALGAIEAAKAVGRDKQITYYGVDGLADAVLSIADGDLTATCVQNAYAQAAAGMAIAKRVLNGEIEQEVIIVPGELITKDNTEKWIKIHTDNGQIKP